MIIKAIKTVTLWVVTVMGKLYPYSLHIKFCVLRDEIYSIWIQNVLGIKSHNVMIKRGTWLDGAAYIHIGDDVTICRNCLIEAKYTHGGKSYNPNITIGNGSYIGTDNHITAMGDIIIGKNLLTGRHVLISDNNHGDITYEALRLPPSARNISTKGAIHIGDNVWIGENACILGGVI